MAIESMVYSDARTVLIVVGSGPIARYQAMADKLGVGSRVYFSGARQDIEQWYQSADVFVFPSTYEAMPLVCIEALASGLPILCTPFKGTEMFLQEGVNGYSVLSAHDIAVKSALLRKDQDRLAMVREIAIGSVRHYDVGKVASDMLSFLQDAGKARKRRELA